MSLDMKVLQDRKIYKVQKEYTEILADFQQLADYVETVRKQQKREKILSTAGSIIAIASLVGFVKTVNILLGIVSVGAFLGVAWMRKHRSQLDLPSMNQRVGFLENFLNVLQQDFVGNQQIYVQLDLDTPIAAKKKTATQPHPHYPQMKIDQYQDRWLVLGGGFIDRTTFNLKICDFTQVAHGSKRGQSGKMKPKRKVKSRGQRIELLLNYSPKRYQPFNLDAKTINSLIKFPKTVECKYKILKGAIRLTVKVPPTYQDDFSKPLMAAFISLGQVLNRSRIRQTA